MFRYALMAITLTVGLVGCKTTDVSEREPNPGSHDAYWVGAALLPGRVTVQFETWTGDWKNWFVTSAIYHIPAGGSLECRGEKRRYRESATEGYYFTFRDKQRMAATQSRVGTLNPVFYNPATGRLHVEEWDPSRGKWTIRADGWVQESWPRVMADACPDLPIPDHVPINEKQTHPTIWKMLEQDPDAPFVDQFWPTPAAHTGIAAAASRDIWYWCFETSNRTPLPAHCPFDIHKRNRGLDSASDEVEPTAALTEDPEHAAQLHLAALLKENNGRIVTDALGREYVLALHAEGDELWAVDETGGILDIGHLAWNASAHRVELDWETFPETRDYHHRPGDALPVFATGDRHPLFAMADWLTDAEDVVLPFMGRDALFRFAGDGGLIVRGTERDFPGTWIVSRGRLILAVEGIEERAAYPWQALAAYLEARAGYEASAG